MTDFSFQLYSARKFPPLDDVLGVIKRLGYSQTEGWGAILGDAKGLRASLDRHGLTMPTSHCDLAQLQNRDAMLRTAETLGLKLLICPNIPADKRKDAADWRRLIDELVRLNDLYRKDGYRFGWHTHEFEFQATSDGRLPIDMLLEASPTIEWQFDIAWAAYGNVDPIPWMERHGNRITAIHIRDLARPGEKLDEDGGEDIGYGTLDWTRLIDVVKRRTKTEFYVFEHDEPNDVVRFATRSMATAKRW